MWLAFRKIPFSDYIFITQFPSELGKIHNTIHLTYNKYYVQTTTIYLSMIYGVRYLKTTHKSEMIIKIDL